jgi:hypothetical protein
MFGEGAMFDLEMNEGGKVERWKGGKVERWKGG